MTGLLPGDDIDLAQYALLRYTALQKTTGYTRPFMQKLNFVISVAMAISFSETQHILELGFVSFFGHFGAHYTDPLHVCSIIQTKEEAYRPPGL